MKKVVSYHAILNLNMRYRRREGSLNLPRGLNQCTLIWFRKFSGRTIVILFGHSSPLWAPHIRHLPSQYPYILDTVERWDTALFQ
jgi:hypothetical protein